MDQAWLDSLSEDWVSEPRSANSSTHLPSLSSSIRSTASSKASVPASRIPKLALKDKSVPDAIQSGQSPLSERSSNDVNIPMSMRGPARPSKLRGELLVDGRGRRSSRTLSASTISSSQFNTVQHKSGSLSPQRKVQEVPEWKQRLLGGDVTYGEQRDLFSPMGLEAMFQQPSQPTAASRLPMGPTLEMVERDDEVFMPSSPPICALLKPSIDGDVDDSEAVGGYTNEAQSQKPRMMKYKLVEEDFSEFSTNDLSQSSNFRPQKSILDSYKAGAMSFSRKLPDSSGLLSVDEKGSAGPSRHVSGQSVTRNEELSPIYIAKTSTSSGTIDYAPSTASISTQHKKHHEQPQRVSKIQFGGTLGPAPFDEKFVNMRRGGCSPEDSFLDRPLSSPSKIHAAVEGSHRVQDSSMHTSTPERLVGPKRIRPSHDFQSPSISTELSLQHAQAPSPSKLRSPLKLFGDYDTFTNQKLLRRLSQFENHNDEESSLILEAGVVTDSKDSTTSNVRRTEHVSPSESAMPPKRRDISKFGHGDLDQYRFIEAASYVSSMPDSEDEDKENVLPSQAPQLDTFRFQINGTLNTGRRSSNQATRLSTNASKTPRITSYGRERRSVTDTHDTSMAGNVMSIPDTPRKHNDGSRAKRIIREPEHDSTTKRRRTLYELEIVESVIDHELIQLQDAHSKMQSVIGRKRKDARHGDSQEAATPKILAMRQILRPRTPSSGQRSIVQPEEPSSPKNESVLSAAVDSRQHPVPNPTLAKKYPESMTSGAKSHARDETRKGSVTTQDFLDEAKKIMAGIRGKINPKSGLASLEESQSEHDHVLGNDDLHDNESIDESTREPFSRPPSRDGEPIARPVQKQEDPLVLNHLRQYEEDSNEVDDIIATSVKSLAMAREVMDRVAKDDFDGEGINEIEPDAQAGGLIVSDPPNIRISRNPDFSHDKKDAAAADKHDFDIPTRGSSGSIDQSTTRSIPTGSSRASDSRRMIASHTVSHLIPEQLAGMVFDKEANKWIKSKASSASLEITESGHGEETDEDPFEDIPDLSVDETREQLRISATSTKRSEMVIRSQPEIVIREDLDLSNGDVASCDSQFQEPVENVAASSPAKQYDMDSEDVEREISIFEDRIDVQTPPPRHRNVTITFSSPIASVIKSSRYIGNKDVSVHYESYDSPPDSQPSETTNKIHVSRRKLRNKRIASNNMIKSALRNSSQQYNSVRPVSPIDEHDEHAEESEHQISQIIEPALNDGLIWNNQRQVSRLAFTTPLVRREIGTLELTPLSDFSANQADESLGLDVSYIRYDQQQMNNTGKRALSISIKEIVEKLTEVEPFEPDWVLLDNVTLNNKRLDNLHKLDQFCGNLQQLDVSHNMISQLNGAPSSLRTLRITHNRLTDLSAWGGLRNLQYVDVSNNDLESLSAFKNLVHLRSLKADHNRITSIGDILHLDGLVSLRLRGNLVDRLDFEHSNLQRLTDLDLRDNKISEVRHLEELAALTTLNLDNNQVADFSGAAARPCRLLKYLRLSSNDLATFDTSMYPDLRVLYLDGNRLGRILGLSRSRYLDSLSLREQQDCTKIDMSFLDEGFEIRKLFLSGNFVGRFEPRTVFLNLQYLELASCGLDELPENFGLMMPNLRVLNLNFNAIRDIEPLAGIARLKRLHLAGNRIGRMRFSTMVLGELPSLAQVDLRNNPITIGFYTPVVERQSNHHEATQDQHDGEEPVPLDPYLLGSGDTTRDARFTSCMDMDTRMLRRYYEIIILMVCRRVKNLDGLAIDRSFLGRHDEVHAALLDAGIVQSRVQRQENESSDATTNLAKEAVQKRSGAASREENVCEMEEEGEEGLFAGQKAPTAETAKSLNGQATEEQEESLLEHHRWPGEDSFA